MTTPPGGGVSPLIRRPSSGLFTTSDFESMSHEQLRAMVEHASPTATAALGTKLTAAAGAITKLGENLKQHASGVEWEGAGGEAFREWIADMGNATLRLGDFSKNAGTWMTHAAATLAGVQSAMPAVSSTSQATLSAYKASNPGQVGSVPAPTLSDQSGGLQKAGPSQKEAFAAQTQLDADRAEAARLMRKLAESYAWSARNIAGAGAPTFPPMPVEGGKDEFEYIPAPGAETQGVATYGPSGMASAAQGSAMRGVASVPGMGNGVVGVGAASGSVVSGLQPSEQPVSMEVDGGVATPEAPVLPTGGAPAPLPHTGPASNTSPLAPVAGLPVPPMGHVPLGSGGNTGPVGGQRQGTLPGVPGRGLVGGLGSVPGLPRDGVVGGRPVPRTSAQVPTQVPRGTVIGTEPGQARTPMGFGAPHVAPPASSVGRVGAGSGRRLAFEPGGVVGGSGQRRIGAPGDRAFTPGGSGLVRSPEGANANLNRRSSQQGQRPDYLVEDEETWSRGNRRVAPPVID